MHTHCNHVFKFGANQLLMLLSISQVTPVFISLFLSWFLTVDSTNMNYFRPLASWNKAWTLAKQIRAPGHKFNNIYETCCVSKFYWANRGQPPGTPITPELQTDRND